MGRKLWAGLDVGAETTTVCVVDEAGETIHEATCPTSVKAVHQEISFLRRRRFARVVIEGGGSAVLARGLRSRGYVVDLYETRQLSKFLRLRRNKTDAGDANGIAQAARLGAPLISRVHLKSLDCQLLASRLTIRRHLVRARVRMTNLLCRQIEHYGGRVRGRSDTRSYRKIVEAEIKALFGKSSSSIVPELQYLVDRREELMERQRETDRDLKLLAMDNDVCRRFMEIPGIGPICALTFYAAIGEPHRFSRATDVGAFLGLTPKLHQSGLSLRTGRISKMGHTATRTSLVQSSVRFMTIEKKAGDLASNLFRWNERLATRRGRGKARVALARKLATIMLAMWRNGERYDPDRWRPDPLAAAVPGPDLVKIANASTACRSCTEAGPGQRRISFGPNGRALFPGVRQARHARRLAIPRAVNPPMRSLASTNFVLTG